MKKIIQIIFCFLFVITSFAQESINNNKELSNHFPLPKVDKRIELLSIVFRLAGNREYNMDNFQDYVKDIHEHFDKYKDHPIIAFAKELHEKNGVFYDAVMAMAVHLQQPPALNSVLPFRSGTPENRWGVDNVNKFVKLLQQFYVDARCEEFFNKHGELYRLAEERFKAVYNEVDISWYKEYYGTQPKGSFTVILGLGNGGGNYGAKVVFPDGKEDDFAIMGAWSFDTLGKPVFSSTTYLPTLIHEFNHSFVNPLIEKNEKELEDAGKKLFEPIRDVMKRQAYGNWNTMHKEALVRASVIRYMKKHNPESQAYNMQIKNELSNGFVWMGKLNDILQSYEDSRAKFSTLESFMPSIISFYDTIAKDCNLLYKNYARVAAIEPFKNNSTDVSPDLTEMKVMFDKPLSGKGYSVFLGQKGKEHYPVTPEGVRYADKNTSILLSLKLKADTEYEFILVGKNFRTPEGYPLLDYKVAFKTKK